MQTPKLLRATPGLRTGNVRLGSNHAYGFSGDHVRLDAELLVDDPAAVEGRDWALQLWACSGAFDGHASAGTLVAQVPVGPLSAETQQYVGAEAFAFPPAGHGIYSMVMVLAAGHDGQFDEVHDYANYPRPECFAQPEINGTAGFELGDDSATLSAEGITNPRTPDNLSGTLSLELWALTAPYTSGKPEGVQLAASQLGCLGGQQAWHDVRVDAPVASKPAGSWHLAMLLREWTPIGFVIRDYANFALPVSWPEAAASAAEAPEAASAPEVAPAAETAEAAEAPAETPAEAKPAAKPSKAGKAASKSKDKEKASKAKPAAVSVNTASGAELAAVKGLSKTVAAAIVAARPFASLDELLKVKGLGTKLLDKLKGSLTL